MHDSIEAYGEVEAILLTMGDRPGALAEARSSIEMQEGLSASIRVVWNGITPAEPGPSDLVLGENVGVSAGRNRGAEAATAPLLLFLDDDARLESPMILASAAVIFERCPTLGAVALRLVDEHGDTSMRHVPRIGGWGPNVSGPVTAFLGGAVVIRRAAFEQVGGYGDELFYAMEETDLSWRLIDAGWRIEYRADLHVFHPRVEPTRHDGAKRITARNRVWIAKRNLPAPLAVAYVAVWLLLGTLRAARRGKLPKGLVAGTVDGIRSRPFERNPIRWRTVWRLSRLGRPPII